MTIAGGLIIVNQSNFDIATLGAYVELPEDWRSAARLEVKGEQPAGRASLVARSGLVGVEVDVDGTPLLNSAGWRFDSAADDRDGAPR